MATLQTQTKRPPRPAGMAWLIPALPVKDIQKALDFCQKAFGFDKGISMTGPDGKLVHAEIKYEGHTIAMFGLESAPECIHKSPATSKTDCPILLYVYCDNVDALYATAKAAGASIISEPADMFWGDRIATFKDPDGYRWTFATNVAAFDASKAPKG
jgi:uncharacterized glyoxalase superfamily protein PhnB